MLRAGVHTRAATVAAWPQPRQRGRAGESGGRCAISGYAARRDITLDAFCTCGCWREGGRLHASPLAPRDASSSRHPERPLRHGHPEIPAVASAQCPADEAKGGPRATPSGLPGPQGARAALGAPPEQFGGSPAGLILHQPSRQGKATPMGASTRGLAPSSSRCLEGLGLLVLRSLRSASECTSFLRLPQRNNLALSDPLLPHGANRSPGTGAGRAQAPACSPQCLGPSGAAGAQAPALLLAPASPRLLWGPRGTQRMDAPIPPGPQEIPPGVIPQCTESHWRKLLPPQPRELGGR